MASEWTDKRTADWANKPDKSSNNERGSGKKRRPAHVSGWFDRTPSGIRTGIDEDEADRLINRPPQKQQVGKGDQSVRRFTRTQFVAHITDRMTFNRNGDMMITIQVPYQFKHLAEPLTDAFGIPLSFDVEVWAPYEAETE